ncbi:glycosyltransferase family 61 protein [Mucilaginibacter jinjuensis]|uniref:Glycosyltransferase family 61 protein n=1 Tax=Mucilaginibacter jinjuensis TaxID=1176721 RepID=A0ABY7T6G6_9SPHI|nr:glycosyltransferase family 61 protein [Mucilaginibacter jinjuensis]WCT11868.1 glycosyltransferase family 61 protein [Mucilaginibacter jinjuensis]
MNTEQLSAHLKELGIVCENNDRAAHKLKITPHSNFYLTSTGVGFKNLKLIPDLLFGNFNKLYFRLYAAKNKLRSPKIKLKDSDYLVIHNFWSGGYHHWVCEALLKLVVSDLDYSQYTLLLPEDYPSFAWQSLKKFQFKDIVLLKKNHTYKIAGALVISNPVSGYYDRGQIRKMKELYAQPVEVPFRKIYISRRKEKLRVIENEEQLYPVLLANGFEIVETQLLSFTEQVALFAEAAIVISIHGAALTNMVFMQPGTKVIELYRELSVNDQMNLCYCRLAEAAMLNYNCYFFKLGRKDNDIDRSNIVVDEREFKAILEV